MRCSHLRALRHTTALLFATWFYGACAPDETVSDDGHGGSTGAAGASGRGGATGAAGTGTAGTTGAAGEGGSGGTIGPGAAGTVGRGGTTGAAGQGGAAAMFWNDKNVAGITIWGYIVGSTWVANSGLMTSSATMRPAMTWLIRFLGR